MPRDQPDETVVETFAVKIDDEPVLANQKRSKVSMLASDALLLVVEHIQVCEKLAILLLLFVSYFIINVAISISQSL
jgi:hypothetical protein